MDGPDAGRKLLERLLAKKHLEPTPANLRALAEELLEYSAKLRGCSYSYLRSVLSDDVQPSPALLEAMMGLERVMSGEHELVAKSEWVQVLAPKGTIPPGTFIDGEVIHCKGCGIPLLKTNPTMAWCPVCSPYR